jgi:hypothetical protein
MYHHKRRDIQEILGLPRRSRFQRLTGRQKMAPFVDYLRATRHGPTHVQWEEQYKFICDESGELMVDFVGRFETLQKDFDSVCRMIGISEICLPHKKKSKRRNYDYYYNDESRHLVSEMYARDIQMFGYTFSN